MPDGRNLAVVVAAYLLGCLTAGYYWVQFRAGRDVRGAGSGSTGATNVGRVLGRPGFAITFLWDCAKGVLAVWLAGGDPTHPAFPMLAALGVVAGHIWPIQLGFRGGKGIAPALGAMLLWDYRALAVFGVLMGGCLGVMRHFTLAGLAACALTPLALFASGRFEPTTGIGVLGLAVMILVAHRHNIRDELGKLASAARARQAKRATLKD
jgi:acyl phosphate:glycerol-3-phosphate acyltransferase